MDKSTFIAAVLDRLPSPIMDEGAITPITHCMDMLYVEGFTVSEAVMYCEVMEEFAPEVHEDVALRVMKRIWLQVKERNTPRLKG
jgi:hypothetical protein